MVYLEFILCSRCGETLHIYRQKHDVDKINDICIHCNSNKYIKFITDYNRKSKEETEDIKDFLRNAPYYISRGK